MTIVTNKYDVEIDFDAAANMMCDSIREELHDIGFDPEQDFFFDTEQDFFDAYCVVHEEKFQSEPEFGKENPVW